MHKDKLAQITIRGLNKMTKHQLRDHIRWLRSRALELEHEAMGAWLVTRKQYGSVMRYNLMK